MILPAEFQVALYENLVQELQKKGNFSQVYRDGDRNVAGAPDLIILHTTVTGFKKGSEMERNVTTLPVRPPLRFIVTSPIREKGTAGA